MSILLNSGSPKKVSEGTNENGFWPVFMSRSGLNFSGKMLDGIGKNINVQYYK